MKMLAPLLMLPLFAACTVGPDYKGPPASASDAVARGTYVRAAGAQYDRTPGVARWWETLGDPVLTGLVDDALENSPSINLAQARIRQAGAMMTQKKADRYPTISGSAMYLRAKLPGVNLNGTDSSDTSGADESSTLEFYNLGATASWEPDLFGKVRRSVEKSRAQVLQRFADLADAQVSLSAQVARAYVNLRDTQERVRLNARSTALQRRSLRLSRQRLASGTVSELTLERLQTDLDSTDAQTLPLSAEAEEYANQIAVLTGREPGALDAALAAPTPVPLPPVRVAIGDPGMLIAHRPDIRSAERALAASNAEIGVNRAKQYPSIKFMGILGLGGTEPSDMFDPGKLTTLLIPSLNWSFLDFGKNRAIVRESEAKRDEASAQYRKTVLEALEDAETSLSRFGNARLQLIGFARAEASATRAAQLNGQRVQAGTSSVIDQLDIERQRLAAAISVAQGKAALTNSYIAVQKSLGLGWTDVPADQKIAER